MSPSIHSSYTYRGGGQGWAPPLTLGSVRSLQVPSLTQDLADSRLSTGDSRDEEVRDQMHEDIGGRSPVHDGDLSARMCTRAGGRGAEQGTWQKALAG